MKMQNIAINVRFTLNEANDCNVSETLAAREHK